MARTVTTTALVLSVFTVLLTGCRSANVRARNLPRELRAPENQKGHDLNLARLSSSGISNSLLAPGDLLEVSIATGSEDEKVTPMVVRVANDGMVTVPLIGPVPVSGLEAFDAGENIAQQSIQRGIYLHPVVTVDIKTKAVNRITVLGAVDNPGVHEIPRGSCDVVTALAAAGGLTEDAGINLDIMRQSSSTTFTVDKAAEPATSSDSVQLAAYQSPQPPSSVPRITRVNLADMRTPGSVDSRLSDRDVVMVPQRKKEVIHVTGLVFKPGQFEMPLDQDVHLLDAIAMAGGSSSLVADKAYVIRRIKGRPEPIVIQASINEAKHNGAENLRLAAGDTITIEQTPATTIVDTFQKLFRVSFGLAGQTSIF